MDSDKAEFLRIFNSIDFQKITDHPNILVAANFWEEDRYCAAKICYKFLRAIDDMIDDHKAKNRQIATGEKKEFETNVNEWLKMVITAADCNPLQKELIQTIERFRIPLWPMEIFARSMIYDINNDGFATLDSFLDYAQGASVAPASIFVHLNGLTKKGGYNESPLFDVREVATPCAVFSYLVHIIRDFQKDQLNNLTYFADNLITKHGLTRQKLRYFAEGQTVTAQFRSLIKEYYELADQYREKTLQMMEKIAPLLESRYQLSLRIIYDLYLMVFERIDLENGKFTTAELNPTPAETKARVYQTIVNFVPV